MGQVVNMWHLVSQSYHQISLQAHAKGFSKKQTKVVREAFDYFDTNRDGQVEIFDSWYVAD